jgi:hypothetical protein
MKFGTHLYPLTHVLPPKPAGKKPPPYALHRTDTGQQITGSISRWSQITFKLNVHLDSPLTGAARRSGSLLTLEVDSRLPHDLVGCLIYYNKKYSPVTNISAGSRRIVKVDLARLKKDELFGDHQLDQLVNKFSSNGTNADLRIAQQNLMSEILLKTHKKYRSRPDSIVVIGWMAGDLIQPEFNPARMLTGSGITVINWELPVEITL